MGLRRTRVAGSLAFGDTTPLSGPRPVIYQQARPEVWMSAVLRSCRTMAWAAQPCNVWVLLAQATPITAISDPAFNDMGDPCRWALPASCCVVGLCWRCFRLLEFQLAWVQRPTRNCKGLAALHYPHHELMLGRQRAHRNFPWIQGKGFAQTRICFQKKKVEKKTYWRILLRATRVMGTQMRASEHNERPPGLHPAFCITLKGTRVSRQGSPGPGPGALWPRMRWDLRAPI